MAKTESAPKHLSAEGREMWRRLRADYTLDDAAGLSLLRAACEAFDRQQEARRQLEKEGTTFVDKHGAPRAHPACAIERDARGQMVAALRALKLAPGAEEPRE